MLGERFASSATGSSPSFLDRGATSADLMRVFARLATARPEWARALQPTDLFRHATADALAMRLAFLLRPPSLSLPLPPSPRACLEKGDAVGDMEGVLATAIAVDANTASNHALDELHAVAVVGMAARVPGCADVAALWEAILARRDCISQASTHSSSEAAGVTVTPAPESIEPSWRPCGMLTGVADFDAPFFGVSSTEAALTCPQVRLFIEACWHCLDDAGYAPPAVAARASAESLPVGPRIGVFASARESSYLSPLLRPHTNERPHAFALLNGTARESVATQAAYRLGLTGPAITVATACSSSLVAVHAACAALRAGECDLALAGGVAVTLPQRWARAVGPGGTQAAPFSPSGVVRPFDAARDGTLPGNGLAVVCLELSARARRYGDRAYAHIDGSAVANDGPSRAGFAAPGIDGQRAVLAACLRNAGRTWGLGDNGSVATATFWQTRFLKHHSQRHSHCA